MMQSLGCLGMALLQDDAGAMQHDVHLMMIFMGIIMVGVVLGFLGVGIAGLMGLKLVRKLETMAERAEGKVSPVLEKTHTLIEELSPKIRTITTNVEQISYTVRSKVDEFSATADEINRTVKDANARTQQKVSRVDTMVTDALNTIHHVSQTIQEGVRKPVQQAAGIIAGLKRGLETLAERSPLINRMRTQQARSDAYEAMSEYESTSARRESTGGFKRTTPYDL